MAETQHRTRVVVKSGTQTTHPRQGLVTANADPLFSSGLGTSNQSRVDQTSTVRTRQCENVALRAGITVVEAATKKKRDFATNK